MRHVHHLSNPSAARLAAVHESSRRIMAVRIIMAVLLVGWLAFVGSLLVEDTRAISGAITSAASNIKNSVH
jgi:uncharacterized membrane protein YgdD (TMEM256/DUF423 family)